MTTEAAQTSRLADLERQCLHMLSAGRSLGDILETVTRKVDEILTNVRSSILLVENGNLKHGAAPGLAPAFNELVDGLPVDEGVGSCGTAAFRRQQVIVTDTSTDPLWEDYREVARTYDLVGCWSTPVSDLEGRVLATFALYVRECRKPQAAELALIDRIAQFVRVAIERSRVMKRLKTSEQRFTILTDHLEDVFWITDESKGTMHYVSPAYATIWGRRCEELYEDPGQWLESIHHADQPRVRAAAARQASEEYVQEYRIVRPDGQLRWISDHGFPVRDEDGEVSRVVGIARDITARKRVELDLRERLKELRCLYDISSCMMADRGREVDELCREIVEVLASGFQFDEIAAAHIEMRDVAVYGSGWQPPVASIRADIDDRGQSAGYIEVGYREEGADQGDGLGPFLSEEKQMLEVVAANVGQMLESRRMARELAQTERLNAMGRLTGGVAHDFNNLLTIIISNAAILARDDSVHPDCKEMAEDILQAGKRGAKLTDRLLAFAQRKPVESKVVDVNELIHTMGGLLHRALGEHIEIEHRLASEVRCVRVDGTQLENALLNLCINARDAMPGGGRLKIETSRLRIEGDVTGLSGELHSGDYVCIAVSDTGAGMDEETRRRAFEPFFTTKEVGKGSGLGLSMVYGFARQSRGDAEIESQKGQGTTVRLVLPAVDQRRDTIEIRDDDQIPRGQGKRVLVVEDDDLVRRNTTRQLRRLGYEVEAVNRGDVALELFRRRDDFDVLFTDIVMPGEMNGYELARRARRIHPDLPILFTSGYTERKLDNDRGVESGPILIKPYEVPELARALAACFT